jgi:uncharacterized protein YoxC
MILYRRKTDALQFKNKDLIEDTKGSVKSIENRMEHLKSFIKSDQDLLQNWDNMEKSVSLKIKGKAGLRKDIADYVSELKSKARS